MKRRLSFWLWTFVGLLATLASIAFANVLAGRFAPRLDVTATGEHQLSPRALAALNRLSDPIRLVVATDVRRVNPEALRDTGDVLERFTHSGKLELSLLDISSPSGARQYQQLLTDLVARDRPVIDAQVQTIRAGATTAAELAAWSQTTLSRSLDDLRALLPSGGGASVQLARTALEQRAAGARIAGRDLAAALAKLEEPLNARIGEIELPATDKASDALRRDVRQASDQISQIVGELRRLSKQADLGDAFSARAIAVTDQTALQRDRLNVVADSLARLPRPGVLRVAGALRQSAAAILIPHTGDKITAIPLTELFPAQDIVLSPGARADNRRRVEEVLTAALAATLLEHPPIAVFMHAEEKPYVLEAPFLEKLRESLAMKGIDMVEWPVLLDSEPTGLNRLDPGRTRPVVFIALPPDSSATARNAEQRGGIERAQRLGAALEKIAGEGANILLSLNPSIQRTYGDSDPIALPLKRFGLEASTGKPIFTERFADGKREVETDRAIISNVTDAQNTTANPLPGALRGLTTYLPWPIGIHRSQSATSDDGVRTTPLLEVPAVDGTWAESRWLRIWQTPRAQRPAMADVPTFEPAQDERGPWVVALSAERPNDKAPDRQSRSDTQRLVVIGSNGWFFDPLTQPAVQVDGRVLAPFPGNQELFDSSVDWLSFADDLIAQSPRAGAIPLIGPIDPERLLWLRLLIILGLPLAVLALGVVHRAVFG